MIHEEIKEKDQKRLSFEDISGMLQQKTNEVEFRKTVERLDNALAIVQNVVEHKLPSVKYELQRELKNKADIATF